MISVEHLALAPHRARAHFLVDSLHARSDSLPGELGRDQVPPAAAHRVGGAGVREQLADRLPPDRGVVAEHAAGRRPRSTISAEPTSAETNAGRPAARLSSTTLPKFSEDEGSDERERARQQEPLRRAADLAEEVDPLPGARLARGRASAGRQPLVVVAGDHQPQPREGGDRRDQPLEPLLRGDPPETEQVGPGERAPRRPARRRAAPPARHRRRGRRRSRRGRSGRGRGRAARRLLRLGVAGDVDRRGAGERAPLEERDPGALAQRPRRPIRLRRPACRAARRRRARRPARRRAPRRGRPEEDRVEVDDVELAQTLTRAPRRRAPAIDRGAPGRRAGK